MYVCVWWHSCHHACLVSLVQDVLAQLPNVPQLPVLKDQQLPQPRSVEGLLLQLTRDLGRIIHHMYARTYVTD